MKGNSYSVCLACGGKLGTVLFEIPDLALVDSFCKTEEEAKRVEKYSVIIRQCKSCNTIQIADPPDTSQIYKNYIYDSSSSPDLNTHFKELSEKINSLSKPKSTNILEIGANDGILLKYLSSKNYLGLTAIDPSPQTGNIDIAGVEILNDFFGKELVDQKLNGRSFDIIVANNCLSHIPNMKEKLELIKSLLKAKGTLIVEVQSTLDLLENCIFDYIYHEHYFYHSCTSFAKLARMAGLILYKVEKLSTKGGSYRFYISKDSKIEIESSVDYWRYREDLVKIHEPESWAHINSYLVQIRKKVDELVMSESSRLVGYGASATGTVLSRYLGIDRKLDFIVDDNPKRQNLYAPDTGVPIKDRKEIKCDDTVIVLAWRHFHYFQKSLIETGAKVIRPLPYLQTYEK
tara:strand:+ start:2938 stop:4146 length:1209 start_codon:yes stop_codon:yes gene_type:complete